MKYKNTCIYVNERVKYNKLYYSKYFISIPILK